MESNAPLIELAELAAFLAFMDAQIERQADSVVPADDAQLERIAKLVAGVKV